MCIHNKTHTGNNHHHHKWYVLHRRIAVLTTLCQSSRFWAHLQAVYSIMISYVNIVQAIARRTDRPEELTAALAFGSLCATDVSLFPTVVNSFGWNSFSGWSNSGWRVKVAENSNFWSWKNIKTRNLQNNINS